MAEITIVDKDGNPVRYASLDCENLKFQFEYFARGEGGSDYEVIQTVSPEEFPNIARMFDLDPTLDVLTMAQQISDMGRGEELKEALNDKKINCDLFTWGS